MSQSALRPGGIPLSSETPISLEECFPVKDFPVRSPNCISWGPHNVLQVCTRWSISFYLPSLLAPAIQIHVRRHPLCYRSETESSEVVVGATWSASVVPEGYYPATARLCMRTTSQLIVYRVTRQGERAVSCSKGIGISFVASQGKTTKDAVPDDNLSALSHLPRRKGGTLATPASLPKKRSSRASRSTAPSKNCRRRRRRSSSVSSDSSGSSSSSTSSAQASSKESRDTFLVSMTTERRREAGPSREKQTYEGRVGPQVLPSDFPPLVSYVWISGDDLAVLTHQGLHIISFYGDFTDDEAPQIHPLPHAVYLFSSEDPLQVSPSLPYLVTSLALVSDCDETVIDPALWPTLSRIVVVASLYFLRIVYIPPTTSKTTPILLAIVEVPTLSAVPTSLHCCLTRHDTSSTQRLPSESHVDVLTFISCAGTVLRGRFQLSKGLLSRCSSGAVSATPITATVPHPSLFTALWLSEAIYGFDAIAGELSIRGFSAVSLSNVQPVETTSCSSSHSNSSFMILGVGQRSIVGFFSGSTQSVVLFRCPSLASADEMPARRAAGVAGVAVHPSCALGLLALHTGYRRHAPLHLLPIFVNDEASLLHRMLRLSGIIPDAQSPELVAAERNSSLPKTPRRFCTSPFQCLFLQQRSPSFFAWELLFSGSAGVSTALHAYLREWHEIRRFPLTILEATDTRSRSTAIHDVALRRFYLLLRQQYGVGLFLRWRLPSSTLLCSSGSNPNTWPWWQLLFHIWRTCPWDAAVVHELILANAVLILAKSCGFANIALAEGEELVSTPDISASPNLNKTVGDQGAIVSCATSPHVLSVHGASAYVMAYLQYQRAALPLAATKTGTERGVLDLSAVLTVADCLSPNEISSTTTDAASHWLVSMEWMAKLQEFLKTAIQSKESVYEHMLFPCSVCDAPSCAAMTLDLSSVATHLSSSSPTANSTVARHTPEVIVRHTTVFSGTSLSPLSLFAPEFVLTRCLACGVSNYAEGPLCRVCGGLLL